jgi:hypothetical protein
LDQSGQVDQQDLDFFSRAIRAGNLWFDLTGDGRADEGDLLRFAQDVVGTSPGDVNLDGRFDSADLLQVFLFGQYEDTAAGNSTWASGDWNGDGEFSSSDLIFALREGSYLAEAMPVDLWRRATDAAFAAPW